VQSHVKKTLFITALVSLTFLKLGAQTSSNQLPNAPSLAQPLFLSYGQSNTLSTTPSQPQSGGVPSTLTRQQAERIALVNNPHIHISLLIAKVQHQAVRERRADELPNLKGNVTAVEANDGSRLSSGSLTASRLLNHSGGGISLSQLITDFGHTSNLVASAKEDAPEHFRVH
jgi:outer membrane protein